MARTVGTDDPARCWQYRWLGPVSWPAPWGSATGPQYAVWLGIAIPAGLAAWAVLGPLVAVVVAVPGLWVTTMATRRITATVDRDRPLRHHLAAAAAEARTARREAGRPPHVDRTRIGLTHWSPR